MKKINNVLWTGGWDSTYRVIQLYRLNAEIQPIYVHDLSRASSQRELETVNRLQVEIPNKFPNASGKILPLIIIKRKDIPTDLRLKLVYKALKRKIALGKQYYWLAYISKTYKNLELSIHKEDMERFFYMNQLNEIKDDALGSSWVINLKKVDFYKRHLFANMSFPLITISKPEMKQFAIDNEFIDVMESTWFCHKSNDKPCGKCNPCKQYIRDGFGYRLK